MKLKHNIPVNDPVSEREGGSINLRNYFSAKKVVVSYFMKGKRNGKIELLEENKNKKKFVSSYGVQNHWKI